jgi:hypothetical protein
MRVVLSVYLLASLMCAALCLPRYSNAEDAVKVPDATLVDPPKEIGGPHSSLPGVVELLKVVRVEMEGDLSKAETEYLSYVRKYPDQPVAFFLLAALKLRMNAPDDAASLLRMASRLTPN